MNAPTGRNSSVSVRERAMAASDFPNSFPMAVNVMTTRKKSNASSVQPRNPATTAARRSSATGRAAVIGVPREWPLDYTGARRPAGPAPVVVFRPRRPERRRAPSGGGDQSPVQRGACQRAPAGRYRGRGGGDEQAARDASRVGGGDDRRFKRHRDGRGPGRGRWQSVRQRLRPGGGAAPGRALGREGHHLEPLESRVAARGRSARRDDGARGAGGQLRDQRRGGSHGARRGSYVRAAHRENRRRCVALTLHSPLVERRASRSL